jgi:gamma-glutamyl-gamma-aminobutyrate hydrolase PuuD
VSEDGLIEAIEDKICPDRFFAVQWHPEIQFASGDTAAEILFDRFLRACRVSAPDPPVPTFSCTSGLVPVR